MQEEFVGGGVVVSWRCGLFEEVALGVYKIEFNLQFIVLIFQAPLL
jgi:hypothetical protein